MTGGDIAKRALASLAAARSGPPEIWTALCDDRTVLAAAVVAEARLDAGQALPLAGLTVAVKDNIDVAGLPTTAACPEFAYLPERDAPSVVSLVEAGAVVIGKTNLDQFATGLVGTRSPYGVVRNAVNPRYIAGGSSSGSAVAVALGQVDLGLATDTAGSGRVPAALNGIVGYKPTQALVSRAGVVPACASFDCVSILAPTLATARAAAASMWRHPPPTDRTLRRVGVPVVGGELEGERRALWDAAIATLTGHGLSVHPLDMAEFFEAGALLYQGALVAERYAAVGEFALAHPGATDPVVLDILRHAAGIPAYALVRDLERLAEIRQEIARCFTDLDALMVPTAGFHPTVDEVVADPTGLNHRLGRYNHFCNPLHMAAVTVPAGRTAAGLPFGVNFYGPAGSDAPLLDLAARFTGDAPATGPSAPAGTRIAVAGAHLRGQPLNHQLIDLGATFVEQTTTAGSYRLYALPTTPPKPGLVRVEGAGAAIEVELWAMSEPDVVRLAASTPWPLAFGNLELADGTSALGFVCQAGAGEGAEDITGFGGWRAYLAASASAPGA